MEKLLENSRKRLVVHIRTRPTAFPHQRGLVLPHECHRERPVVPMEVAGGLGIQLEQRAARVGSSACSPHHPPANSHGSPRHRDGCFLSGRHMHKNNSLVVQKEEMGLQGLSCPGWVQLPTPSLATGHASISLYTSWCADTDHRGVL